MVCPITVAYRCTVYPMSELHQIINACCLWLLLGTSLETFKVSSLTRFKRLLNTSMVPRKTADQEFTRTGTVLTKKNFYLLPDPTSRLQPSLLYPYCMHRCTVRSYSHSPSHVGLPDDAHVIQVCGSTWLAVRATYHRDVNSYSQPYLQFAPVTAFAASCVLFLHLHATKLIVSRHAVYVHRRKLVKISGGLEARGSLAAEWVSV